MNDIPIHRRDAFKKLSKWSLIVSGIVFSGGLPTTDFPWLRPRYQDDQQDDHQAQYTDYSNYNDYSDYQTQRQNNPYVDYSDYSDYQGCG